MWGYVVRRVIEKGVELGGVVDGVEMVMVEVGG